MAYIGSKPADKVLTASDITDGIISNAKLAQDIISADTALGAEPADTDEFLVSDAGTLKRIDYSLINGTSVIVSSTYDISTATGTQAVTGAGFAPSSVIAYQTISNTAKWSVGMGTKSDNDYQCSVSNYLNTTTGVTDEAYIVSVYTSNIPDKAQATISSWDADGITLSWTKTGSPTGSAVINYMFMK